MILYWQALEVLVGWMWRMLGFGGREKAEISRLAQLIRWFKSWWLFMEAWIFGEKGFCSNFEKSSSFKSCGFLLDITFNCIPTRSNLVIVMCWSGMLIWIVCCGIWVKRRLLNFFFIVRWRIRCGKRCWVGWSLISLLHQNFFHNCCVGPMKLIIGIVVKVCG
jgi:hypothetical protein